MYDRLCKLVVDGNGEIKKGFNLETCKTIDISVLTFLLLGAAYLDKMS